MSPMLILTVLAIGLFALCAAGIGVSVFFYQRYANPEPSLIQQRLIQIKYRHEKQEADSNKAMKERMARLYKDTGYSNEALARKLEKLDYFNKLRTLIHQAGLKIPADKYFINFMVMPVLVMGLIGIFSGSFIIMVLGLIVPGISHLALIIKKKRRLNRFVRQMPDALSMVTSSLRAGHSFQAAMGIVAAEMGDPAGTEFSGMVRDINLGIPVKDAMEKMVFKLDGLPDVHMFATAVIIQREAGGNLAEVLEKLGYTIRERFKLRGQIAALTGQSRLTGYVLGCAPAFLLLLLSVFIYGYVAPLYETQLGNIALGIAAVQQVIGFVIMRKIVDIRV